MPLKDILRRISSASPENTPRETEIPTADRILILGTNMGAWDIKPMLTKELTRMGTSTQVELQRNAGYIENAFYGTEVRGNGFYGDEVEDLESNTPQTKPKGAVLLSSMRQYDFLSGNGMNIPIQEGLGIHAYVQALCRKHKVPLLFIPDYLTDQEITTSLIEFVSQYAPNPEQATPSI